jgi:mRNA interferase HicA
MLGLRPMRRHELFRRIAREAYRQGVAWRLERQGASHELWRCGHTQIAVPRHAEIGNQLAQAIYEELEAELGKDWWRR